MCNEKRKELKIESCGTATVMNGLLHGVGLKAWKVTNYIAIANNMAKLYKSKLLQVIDHF